MAKQKFGLKITLESTGEDGTYQRTTLEQNYSNHQDQVRDQRDMFPAVIAMVGGKLVEQSKKDFPPEQSD